MLSPADSPGSSIQNQSTLTSAGGYQFGAFCTVGQEPNLVVCKRTRPSMSWSTQTITSATIGGNPLGLPFTLDPHNTPAIGVDADGYVHVAANMHGTHPWQQIRSTSPYDITDWASDTPNVHSFGTDDNTYPQIVRLSNGTLLLCRRHRFGTGNVPGEQYLEKLTAGNTTWTVVGSIAYENIPSHAPYWSTIWVDENDRVHVAWIWALNSPANDVVDHMTYVYSDNAGTTWKSIGGTTMTLPITRTNDTAALTGLGNTDFASGTMLYGGGMTTDTSGRPHFFLADRFAPSNDYHIYYDGAAWQIATVTGISERPNILRWRGNIWALGRITDRRMTLRQLTGTGTGQQILFGPTPDGWAQQVDLEALKLYGTIEMLIPSGDTPVVYTLGDGARRAA